jgi:hypothetical protein
LVKKAKQYKPTNKQRDEAIAHMIGRLGALEQMIEGLAQSVDMYVTMKGDRDEFLSFYNKKVEEYNDEQEVQETDGESVEENTKDEGRRSEGIREDK